MSGRGGGTLGALGEDQMVARFRRLVGRLPDSVLLGPGDDAAALRSQPGRLLLLTCDMMVEDMHFRRAWALPEQIGWKAMAQNMSDIAAMGGQPAAAVCSLAAPGDLEAEVTDRIAQGLIRAASEYGAFLVGGDLVGSRGAIVVGVALTGWVEEELMLRRRGARPGEAILVTGALGASAAGLAALQQGLSDGSPELERAVEAHHQPRPRLAEARAIALTRRATAMMDLSDGLADDLPRLCLESGVGARVFAERIPVDPACLALSARVRRDALQMAISGGEDYELLFTCPQAAVGEVAAAVAAKTGTAVTRIGEIVAGTGVSFVRPDGRALEPEPRFSHFAP